MGELVKYTNLERLGIVVGVLMGSIFCACIIFMLFAYLPVGLYTQAECLRKGYPKYNVSIGLERYCMNLEGTITVRVDRLGDGKH